MKNFESKLLVLRIKLEYVKPFIIRKVLVRNTISFEKLHHIIQISMGWENYHLYSFKYKDIYIEDRHAEGGFFSKPKRAHKIKIAEFLNETKDKIKYTYDFGDNWEHQISVSKVLPDDPAIKYPECLMAQRACPPEDCGGTYGYYEILNALASREEGIDEDDEFEEDDEDEYNDILEWLGDDYNPESVDIKEINKGLKSIKM